MSYYYKSKYWNTRDCSKDGKKRLNGSRDSQPIALQPQKHLSIDALPGEKAKELK